MAKESLRSKVVKDVSAAEKAIVSEEKKITTKIREKTHGQKKEDSRITGDEHIEEEV